MGESYPNADQVLTRSFDQEQNSLRVNNINDNNDDILVGGINNDKLFVFVARKDNGQLVYLRARNEQ